MFLLNVLLDLTDKRVLPIICSSKHFSFFVFYFNVSNKISSTPPRLLNFQFSNPPPSPSLFIPTPLLLSTQEQTNLKMQNFILMFTFFILDLFCKFCPKINLVFWCCLIHFQVFQPQRPEASDFPCYKQFGIYKVSFRSSRLQMFFKIGVLKNFAIFMKKHLSWSLFLTTLQAYMSATLLKRDSNTVVFL